MVSFELDVDATTGKPRAKAIQIQQAGTPGIPNLASDSVGRMEGTVESWKERWGWITRPALNKNVFAHRDDVVGGPERIEAGARVTFEVIVGVKISKDQAVKIEVDGPQASVRMPSLDASGEKLPRKPKKSKARHADPDLEQTPALEFPAPPGIDSPTAAAL